jgi:DNA-binding MarR family transcriptional regulator
MARIGRVFESSPDEARAGPALDIGLPWSDGRPIRSDPSRVALREGLKKDLRTVPSLSSTVGSPKRPSFAVNFSSLAVSRTCFSSRSRYMICSVLVNSSVPVDNSTGRENLDTRRRLLMFLNRYIEQIGIRSDLSNHEAAVLTAVDWVDKHPECLLNQTQMATVLGISTTLLSSRVNKLRKSGFCEPLSAQERTHLGIASNREGYFRMTPAGVRALNEYAQLMFELPSNTGQEIGRMPEYRTVTKRIDEILVRELTQRFQEARH